MSKIFWDSNLFIYLFQKHPDFGPEVEALRKRMKAAKDDLVTSFLTLAEVQVKPMRDGNIEDAQSYANAISHNASLVAFDRDASAAYLAIRQHTRVRGADAIQLACAAASGSRFFVTEDRQLLGARIPGYELFVVTPSTIPL